MDLMQLWLFESPWPTMIVLGLLALIVGWAGRQRASRRLLTAAAVLLILAPAVYLAARLVTTRRELLLQNTDELVRLTAPVQVEPLRACFDDQAWLVGPAGEPWLNLEQLLGMAAMVQRVHRVAGQEVLSLDAQVLDANTGRSTLHVRTELESEPGLGLPTRWVLTWRWDEAARRWRVTQVQWVAIAERAPTRDLVP